MAAQWAVLNELSEKLYVLAEMCSSPHAPCSQGGLVKAKRGVCQQLVHRADSQLFKAMLLSEKGTGVVFPQPQVP